MCEDLKFSIDDYISGEESICREERQYALYLSNVLRYYGKRKKRKIRIPDKLEKLFKACGFNLTKIEIINVFYEATFMRDVFERNRRFYLAADKKNLKVEYLKNPYKHADYNVSVKNSFNYRLLCYCSNIINGNSTNQTKEKEIDAKVAERNYGGTNNFISESELEDLKITIREGDWDEFKTRVRAMMNAKPDIAVYYKQEGQLHLKFLECKFESKESKYPYNLTQTGIQGNIAEFIHENYFNLSIDNMKGKDQYYSDKIVFCRDGETDRISCNDDEYGRINISDVIELEKIIFE